MTNEDNDNVIGPADCPACGGTLAFMGGLGNRSWFRCVDCGMECSNDEARVAQMAERQSSKLDVVGSKPSTRSKYICPNCRKSLPMDAIVNHDKTCEALATKGARTAVRMSELAELMKDL